MEIFDSDQERRTFRNERDWYLDWFYRSIHVNSPSICWQRELEKFVSIAKRKSWKCCWQDVFEALKTIICHKITDPLFDEIINLYPTQQEFFHNVLQLIACRVKNLSRLKISSKPGSVPQQIERSTLMEISKMKSLRVLEITKFHLDLQELMLMCREMPNLNTIDVSIRPRREFPTSEDFVHIFGNVESFLFSSLWCDDINGRSFQRKLTIFCIKHLPNLRYVGKAELILVDMSRICIEDIEHTSQIQQLILKMDLFEESKGQVDMFSNITSLILGWSVEFKNRPVEETQLHLLRKFRHLKALKLINYKNERYLEKLLHFYYLQLIELHIHIDILICDMKIDLEFVQRACPNLERLHIHGLNVVFSKKLCMENFKSLQELKIKFNLYPSEVRLSKLLASPTLKTVELHNLRVSKKELRKTLGKKKSKKIMNEVLKFSLVVNSREIDTEKKKMQEIGAELVAEVLKSQPNAVVTFKINL